MLQVYFQGQCVQQHSSSVI